ncbi:DUF6585 family protein [Streptomyces sp. A012304]|uniref:DUF6585 family protein n=1 Tax=Streptomyces sp. A012304 TaxID=375446 RepID=UPI002231A0E0|nr:DUF6585 family protein [Streptomyces sp. A012304]GKQ40625.1 hypothetical protein ALMP_71480 [Streptomyces sp. A012304]
MSVAGSPSPEVTRLALRNGFGRLERTFLPRKEVNVKEENRRLFMAAAVSAIAILATGGVLLWIFVSWALALFPLWVAVLAIGALFNSPNFRKKLGSHRLYLFEEGLLLDTGAGRLFAVRWDQAVHYQETVQEVINYKGTKTPFKSAHTSTLVAPDGTSVQISDFFADYGTWVPLIAEAIARAQAQRVWEAVRDGQKAAYGPFELDAGGIADKRRGTLPWSAVEAIDVREGLVVVREHGQVRAWAQAQVKTVPNLLVFLTVASNLQGG